MQSINQTFNQSIRKSTDQSINLSDNQSDKLQINQSIYQLIEHGRKKKFQKPKYYQPNDQYITPSFHLDS